MKKIIFIILALVAVQAIAEELKIQVGEEEYTFHEELLGNYFGVYSSPLDLTFGSDLHLFPNGDFIITNWIDIGGREVVASGKYKVKGHRLKLKYDFRKKAEFPVGERDYSKVYLYSGSIEEGHVSMGHKIFLLNPEQLEEARRGENFLNYCYMKRAYLSWERILQNLKNEIIEQGDGSDVDR